MVDIKVPVRKIVLIGEPGVGKTSLMQRFVADRFAKKTKPTKSAYESLK